jgi:hypothetical protein
MLRLILASLTLTGLTACCGAPPTPARIDPTTVKPAKGDRPGQAGCIDCALSPEFNNDALTSVVLTSRLSPEALTFSYVSAKVLTSTTAAPITVPVQGMLDGKISIAAEDFTKLQTVDDWKTANSTLVVEYKKIDGSGTDYEKWPLKINK